MILLVVVAGAADVQEGVIVVEVVLHIWTYVSCQITVYLMSWIPSLKPNFLKFRIETKLTMAINLFTSRNF